MTEASVLYSSPLGNLSLTFYGTRLTALQLAGGPSCQTRRGIQAPQSDTLRWLNLYFAGRDPGFTPPLAPQGTPFQLRVWQELLKIPYGHTSTYGDLARRLGCRSPQAVGQAAGRNPITLIIPCHRLIAANGLGGYAYGPDIKQHLLDLEQRMHIEVVAAIIHDAEGRIFATQRGYGEWKDWWEFPGGKMEAGETPEEALRREIWEELATHIAVERLVETVEWDYPAFHLTMHCYRCHVESGRLELKEHEAARWLTPSELESVDWLPADRELIKKLKQ